MNSISKYYHNYRNHIIIIAGSNLTGFLNLILVLIILRLATEDVYNAYTALAAFFLIFSVPNKVIKSLTTTYGENIIDFLKLKFFGKKDQSNIFKIIFFGILYFALIVSISGYGTGDYIESFFLAFAAIFQFLVFGLTGIVQHNQNFLKSSTVLLIQNIGKIFLVVALFLILSNIGIFLGTIISLIFAGLYLWQTEKYRFDNNSTEVRSMEPIGIKTSDLILNITLFVLLEILFNIDSILVLHNLPTQDAYIYNALVIIKKSMFMSILGVGQILLSKIKNSKTNKIQLLSKNLILTIFIGFGLSFAILIFKNSVFDILEISTIYLPEMVKFLVASVLFAIFTIMTMWFTGFENTRIKGIIIGAISIFIIYYSQVIVNIDSTLNNFIGGIIILITLESVLLIKSLWE